MVDWLQTRGASAKLLRNNRSKDHAGVHLDKQKRGKDVRSSQNDMKRDVQIDIGRECGPRKRSGKPVYGRSRVYLLST